MSILDKFCGFKTAYFVDADTHPALADLIAEDELFDVMATVALPDGWEFEGQDISGAAGYVITFNVAGLPNTGDMESIAAIMDRLNKAKAARQWNEANIFNTETFQDWSVYDLNEGMVAIAFDLWERGGMKGDYGRIADMMNIASAPHGFNPQGWTPELMKAG